jgi:hypothetical protein
MYVNGMVGWFMNSELERMRKEGRKEGKEGAKEGRQVGKRVGWNEEGARERVE